MARRRVFIRTVWAGVATFALVLGGATTAVAGEADPVSGAGSISGVVTSGTAGPALAGADVHAETFDGSASADAVTDSSGAYTLEGLVDGDYIVRFSTPDDAHLAEYWRDTRQQWRAEPVSIIDGAAVTGIDAALATPPIGSISGTVTREDDGSPVMGVTVAASGAGGAWASTTTDENGDYVLDSLFEDSYVVSFFADGTDLKREYWQNTTDYSAATRVIIADTAVTDIDASLSAGAAIEGIVTRAADDSPIHGVYVSALDANNEIVGATETDAAGEYSLGGLPVGTYRVRFGSPTPELVSEYWKDSYGWGGATLVTVGEQQTVGGIDADLDAAAYISGTVTKTSDGSPVVAAVTLYDANDAIEDPSVDTDSDGNYRVAVPPGTYRVLFHAYEVGVLEEYWENAREWEDATLLTVTAAQEIEGIDAELGSVTDPEPEPKPTITLSSGSIRAGADLSFSGTGYAPGQKVAFELRSAPIVLGTLTADTDGVLTGSFRIPATVPAGSHTLVALDGSTIIASAAVTVTAAAVTGDADPESGAASDPGGELADTGGDAPAFALMMASGLLFAGLLLVRRRRAHS